MTTKSSQTGIDDLFARAVDLPPDERDAFLKSACDDDADVLADVQKLLAADEQLKQAPEFLASKPRAQQVIDDDDRSDDPLIGQHIGPYGVQCRLGEGGFGAVYLAARTKDYRQEVAIKVVMDDVKNLPRFERERQLLADLKHEHIARLLDGGTLPDGRPYIIMEYINGRPITQYCDENRLPVKARLALFKQVCKAVSFAHRYGAIHRDIKPLNILVNEQGIVKLLDFGIAKLLDSPARRALVPAQHPSMSDVVPNSETVSFAFDSSSTDDAETALGAIGPMSPPYASPEQARGEEVSTASDIYSLGVVLYELLTGCRPYYFQCNTLDEVQRVICGAKPPPPSALVLDPSLLSVSFSGAKSRDPETLADLRGTTPKILHKTLNGDLEAVVLQALDKDQTKRYQTVEKLSDELDDFLKGLPVDARPVSRRERAVRWVRRNKTVTALAVVAIVALVGGTVASTLFGIDARRKAVFAAARAYETIAVLEFVENKIFAAARPEGQDGGLGHDVTLRRAIESALPFVEGSFTDRPLIEARLRSTLATSFSYLGDAKTAARQCEIALAIVQRQRGADHPDTLGWMNNLANAYSDAGRFDEAISLYEQALVAKRKMLSSDHPDTLNLINNLAVAYRDVGRFDEAIELFKETAAAMRKELGAEHPHTLNSINNLATAYYDSGRRDEALQIYKGTLTAMRKELGAEHPHTLQLMNNLAGAYRDAGRLDEGIQLHKETLTARRKKLGAEHPDTLASMNNLGGAYLDAGRPDEAVRLLKETLAVARKKLSADHPKTLALMNNLANAYFDSGRRDDALLLYEQTLAATREKLGADHPHTLNLSNTLANAYRDQGRLDEALQLHKQTLTAMRKKLGADHPDTLASMNNLAEAYYTAGRLDDALPLYEQTIVAMRQKLGADHPDTLSSMSNLANAHLAAGRLGEAIALYEQTLNARRKKLGENHPNTLTSMNNLAIAYYDAGRLAEAMLLYEQTLAARSKKLGTEHLDTLTSMNNLAIAYGDAGRFGESIELFEKSLAVMRKKLGKDDSNTLCGMNAFAWILATAPIDSLRNGDRARTLATEACELTEYKNSEIVSTLAAANAEIGDYDSAIKWSLKSLELLGENGNAAMREQSINALANYKNKKPMRQPVPVQGASSRDPSTEIKPSASRPNEAAANSTAAEQK